MRGVRLVTCPQERKRYDFQARSVDVRRLKSKPKEHSARCLIIADPAFESASFSLTIDSSRGKNDRLFLLKTGRRLFVVDGLCFHYDDHRKGVRGKCLIERVKGRDWTSSYVVHLLCWAPAKDALTNPRPVQCPEHLTIHAVDWTGAAKEDPDGQNCVVVYRTAGLRPVFRYTSPFPDVKAFKYRKASGFTLEDRNGRAVGVLTRRKFHFGDGAVVWCFVDSKCIEPIHGAIISNSLSLV